MRVEELTGSEEGNPSSKKGKRRQKKPMVVQKLYQTCNEVFSHGGAGIVPSVSDVGRIRSILDNMKPGSVGLTSKLPFLGNIETTGAPPITYLHVYDCPKFSIGIFCLPPSASIPLHNHPGMTVFSKLLIGSMHIKSYDWVDVPPNFEEPIGPPHSQSPSKRLAKVKANTVFTAPCETSILFPASGGNIHCFTGMTACAVLDVLGPPYSDPDGRHCTYYNVTSCASHSAVDHTIEEQNPWASKPDSFTSKFNAGDAASVVAVEGEEYVWLEERENPDNSLVVGAEYKGPKIVEC